MDFAQLSPLDQAAILTLHNLAMEFDVQRVTLEVLAECMGSMVGQMADAKIVEWELPGLQEAETFLAEQAVP